jgi:hypothetical protein
MKLLLNLHRMESFLDNRQQLMKRVLDLAGRYGLTSGDFAVVIRLEPGANGTYGLEAGATSATMSITFPVGPQDPAKSNRYGKMLESIGVSRSSGTLIGSFLMLRDTLDRAAEVIHQYGRP